MRLSEMVFNGVGQPIEGFGPDFYRVGGTAYPAPALFRAGVSGAWGGYEDVAALTALAGEIDFVLIGTGPDIAPLPAALRRALEQAGLGVEIMSSPTACRTYNVLLSEGRRVAVALLPAG